MGLAKVIGLLKQTNPQIVAALETDSEVLARIQDEFHTMVRSRNQEGLQPIEITCFFEELPLPGVDVVSKKMILLIPFTLIFLFGLFLLIPLSYPAISR
jgi:protein SERAC1